MKNDNIIDNIFGMFESGWKGTMDDFDHLYSETDYETYIDIAKEFFEKKTTKNVTTNSNQLLKKLNLMLDVISKEKNSIKWHTEYQLLRAMIVLVEGDASLGLRESKVSELNDLWNKIHGSTEAY